MRFREPTPTCSIRARPCPACECLRNMQCNAAEAPTIGIDLASGILIKNNHISLGGGLPAVLTQALEKRRKGQRVQVEVRSAQELEEALKYGAEAILLDHMSPADVRRSVERIKEVAPGEKPQTHQPLDQESRWIPTEASGGIVLENVRAYAETGVDFISIGALTHSAKAADISMSITAEPN